MGNAANDAFGADDEPITERNTDALHRRYVQALSDLRLNIACRPKIVHGRVVMEFRALIGDREIDRVLRRLEELAQQQQTDERQPTQTSTLFSD